MKNEMDAHKLLALAREDLALYAIAQRPRFQLARHHATLADHLEAAERGEIQRLMVFMPPRHGKSLLSTQNFPAWYLGKNPTRSIITASYSQDIADDFGRRVRNLVANDVHSAIFPRFQMSGDSKSMRRFDTEQGGSYYAVGRGGPITGRGANLLLIDDPIKDREEARSETIRRNLHEWYENVAVTRLQPDGVVIIIQTRWHGDDLAGWLLREHKDQPWVIVSMPAIAETTDEFRQEGEALWPEKYPVKVLRSIREQVGATAWASLYQQRPSAAENAVFQREWFRTYRDMPTSFQKIVQSWDTAFKTGTENDYSVSTTWGQAENGYYLLALWRGKVEFPELKRQFANQADAWKPHAILIEDKASGQSLIQELKLGTRFAVVPVKVDSDKRTRAEAVTPLFESGRVFFPEGAPWLQDYIDELLAFDAGAHDDCVDSTTQALNYLRDKASDGFFRWLKSATAKQEAARAAEPVHDSTGLNVVTEKSGTVVPALPAESAEQATAPFKFADPYGVLRRPPRR